MKGLADADGNGKITMFELQSYIQANVAKYSEFKQIPMVSGDLSKSFFKVDPSYPGGIKKQKAENLSYACQWPIRKVMRINMSIRWIRLVKKSTPLLKRTWQIKN
ncbi:MAG: hypothetical protein IPO68_06170 [Chitinophagaceae bacterium]|nr:hypothetical protein [Chitinophagaceae bacterium]